LRFIFPTAAGQATVGLTPFKHVIGVDPSAKMIESARDTIGAVDRAKFRFEESSAENVHTLGDGTVDLIIAGMPHITRTRRL
jgi:ubiquinone/menaquinone biosynthesis C-methylase UbiE